MTGTCPDLEAKWAAYSGQRHGAEVRRWWQGAKLSPLAKSRRRFERPDLVRQAMASKPVGEKVRGR
jgi:hypothetical protein